jgi:hypothetical protein
MIIVYAGLAIGASLLVGISLLLFLPYIYLDGFLAHRITRTVEEVNPGYSVHMAGLHYRILENRLECKAVRIIKSDSTFSCTVAVLFVDGIERTQLLLGKALTADNFASFDVSTEDIVLNFPKSQYELRCERLRISVPDSEIVVDNLELYPSVDDEQFFKRSEFRRTRYRITLPQCRVKGLACLALLQGKSYSARAAQIDSPSLTVLINKDKPANANSSSPRMPNVIFSSIKKSMQINSIRIMNGRLKYGERFAVGAKPALLTFDSMQILAQGPSNSLYHGDTVVIRAEGKFMQSGTMNVFMSIPVASPEFTFHYSGSLSTMGLSTLNPFLEVAEHKRLKTGILHSATFDINVIAGRANGIAHVVYKDLKIVAIEDHTGRESGIANSVVSFLANNIKLRTTNLPDKIGSMKIGEVNYTKKSDEAFLEFAWLALRSGMNDVVGF